MHRKYPEVYLALDIVLRGAAGSVRLAAILSSIHGDNISKLVSSAPDAESRVRGADQWSAQMEALSAERRATLESFSGATFELPAETLAAGMSNLLVPVLQHANMFSGGKENNLSILFPPFLLRNHISF